MPTQDWLREEFSYGYDSGDVLSLFPNAVRRSEEKIIGGSYRRVFLKAAAPYLRRNSVVLELGPGKGSWTRAILKRIPQGELQVIDFQDVHQWLQPENYRGRLITHQVTDNSFDCVPDNYFDFFWSFGVLCHNNVEDIEKILANALPKMKQGAYAVHQYGDWNKLDVFGWNQNNISIQFKDLPDDEIWWPRNNPKMMTETATRAGWTVVTPDLNLVKRDSIIVLRCDRAVP